MRHREGYATFGSHWWSDARWPRIIRGSRVWSLYCINAASSIFLCHWSLGTAWQDLRRCRREHRRRSWCHGLGKRVVLADSLFMESNCICLSAVAAKYSWKEVCDGLTFFPDDDADLNSMSNQDLSVRSPLFAEWLFIGSCPAGRFLHPIPYLFCLESQEYHHPAREVELNLVFIY